MMSYKYLVWCLVAIPTVLLIILLRISPQTFVATGILDSAFILSLTGTLFSYYGLIFSFYAALQVSLISNLYFFKTRSPQIQKKLWGISKSISDFGREPSEDLPSQRFISESAVAFRSAKRIKNKHVKLIAEQAEASLQILKNNMKTACGPGRTAGQIPNYWEFLQKVSELLDELKEQTKDARAQA